MKTMTDTKIAIAVGLLALVSIGGVFAYQGLTKDEPSAASVREAVVRADSHRIGTADNGKVTLVEFLDFECESCGAAYPFVEQLREQYKGRVTFVARYFPVPSHRNAENAAHAVESAARQGKFEEMYKRMFETQPEWGEQQDSNAPLFRSYAEDLGLDMDRYDQDVKSASVAKRVQKDLDDGKTLGVSGTPTFFLNGKKLEVSSEEDFIQAIDQALAE